MSSNAADLYLFDILAPNFTKPSRFFRHKLWEALRQDLPDLSGILADEAAKDAPHPKSAHMMQIGRQIRKETTISKGAENLGLVDDYYALIPQSNTMESVYPRSRTGSSHEIPAAMLIGDQVFNDLLKGSDASGAAARMLTDLFQSVNDGENSDLLLDPAMTARIDTLLEHASVEQVSAMFELHPDLRESTTQFCKDLGTQSSPTFQRLSQFFGEVETLAAERWDELDGAPTRKTSVNPEAEENLFVPGNGATAMLLDARAKLEEILKPFIQSRNTKLKKKYEASILDSTGLWDAVRNTAMQEQFVSALSGLDAFTRSAVSKDNEDPDTNAATDNQLLAGIELKEKQPAKDKSAIAFSAFKGYFDTITSADDLNEVLRHLVRHDDFMTQMKREGGPVSQVVARAARRVNYSLAEAWTLSYYQNVILSPKLLTSLSGESTPDDAKGWTPSDIDSAFSDRPFFNNPSNAWALLATVIKEHPNAINEVSDRTIFLLARTITFSRAPDLIGKAGEPNTFNADFQARIAKLPITEKTIILSRWATANWGYSGNWLEAHQSGYMSALMESFAPDQFTEVIENAQKLRGWKSFTQKLSPYLSREQQGSLQQTMINEINTERGNNHCYRITETDFQHMARLLGYGSDCDKAKTLDGLKDDFKRSVFSELIQTVAYHEDPNSNEFYGNENNSVKGDLNLYKNIAIDLHQYYGEVVNPVVELTDNSTMVKLGIAKTGDQLTWEGFTHLVGPFLDEPRPSLDAPQARTQESAQELAPAATATVFDKATLKEKLSNPDVVISGQNNGHGHFHGKRMCHPLMGYPSHMVQHMLRDVLHRHPMHHGPGHGIQQLIHVTNRMGLNPDLVHQTLIKEAAKDAIRKFETKDGWFALKTAKPEQEQKSEVAGNGPKAKSIPIK